MTINYDVSDDIAEVVIDHPPVNAPDVKGWFDLAQTITDAGRNPDVRCVVLRAEGAGFCAGVDIKEIQADSGQRSDHRCEPRVLRRVQGGVRVRGARRGGRARLLPRRRHRARWERRHASWLPTTRTSDSRRSTAVHSAPRRISHDSSRST